MTKSIIHANKFKPDDEAEWRNVLQLMYHVRQALACSICGKLDPDLYTPVQEHCHHMCAKCRGYSSELPYNCSNCKNALQVRTEDGFEANSITKNSAIGFVQLCKFLLAKDVARRWSDLHVSTQNGSITFGQLIQEGCDAESNINGEGLGEKFRKKVKEKEHHCRCGSGTKRGENKGNLTCLGQRCACYRNHKACVQCKCLGCKNPNGASSREREG